jgi:hypothetical protein
MEQCQIDSQVNCRVKEWISVLLVKEEPQSRSIKLIVLGNILILNTRNCKDVTILDTIYFATYE